MSQTAINSQPTSHLTINGVMTLGKLLQLYRQLAGLDQTEMGDEIGASRPTISAFERDVREPNFSQVVKWAQITGQPIEPLIEAVAVNAETAPAEADAVSLLSQHSVRPKRLELPTFWMGAGWTAEDDVQFRAHVDASLSVPTVEVG